MSFAFFLFIAALACIDFYGALYFLLRGLDARRAYAVRALFLLLAGVCVVLGLGAVNARATTIYGALTTFSQHFPDRGYNQVNPGLGVEADSGSWAFALGEYRNSFRRTTVYATAGYLPLVLGHFRLGAFAGPATGYNVPVIGGMVLAWRERGWGVNVLAVPPGPKAGAAVVALQLLKAF